MASVPAVRHAATIRGARRVKIDRSKFTMKDVATGVPGTVTRRGALEGEHDRWRP
jgi:hypothetical protein